MKNTRYTIAASMAASIAMAALPSTDLAGCQDFAKTFDNTCRYSDGNPAAVSDFLNWSSSDMDTMSCVGKIRCPDASGESTYTSSNPCTWQRALCVSCRQDGSKVLIKVQSNAMPNHCFTSTVNNATPENTEWEVVWQPDVTNIMNYSSDDFDSSSKTDEILCDIQRTSYRNMNSASGF